MLEVFNISQSRLAGYRTSKTYSDIENIVSEVSVWWSVGQEYKLWHCVTQTPVPGGIASSIAFLYVYFAYIYIFICVVVSTYAQRECTLYGCL